MTACLLTVNAVLPPEPAEAAPLLSLERAQKNGTEQTTIPELADLLKNVQMKKMELVQAQQAVNNEAEKKANGKAQAHGLSRDVALSMKIPESRLAVNKAQKEIDNTTLSIKSGIEQLYMQAYMAQVGLQNAQETVSKAQKSLEDTKAKVKFGFAKQEDVKTAEKQVEQANSGYKQAQLALKAVKLDLGMKINMDLEGDDYEFRVDKSYATLNEKTMWQLVQKALDKDVNLYDDREARRLAEAKVSVTKQFYQSRFGDDAVKLFEAMYEKSGETDYGKFMAKYNEMAANIEKKWRGYKWVLVFALPFLKRVPKKKLQGEYEGTRYFEDTQNALPLAMLDLEKAKLKEGDTQKKLIAKVKKSYLDAKQAEETYIQALKATDQTHTDTEAMKKQYTFGFVTKDAMDQQLETDRKADQNAMTGYITYKSQLSKLDLDTSGSVVYQAGNPPYEVDSGTAPFEKRETQKAEQVGTWKLEPIAETMTSAFSVELDPKYGATRVVLTSKTAQQPIGEIKNLKDKLVHLNLVFSDAEDLVLEIYKGNSKVATAKLEGYAPSGEIINVQ